jgi:predicted RNA-binding protein YlxR (DUF448 family)
LRNPPNERLTRQARTPGPPAQAGPRTGDETEDDPTSRRKPKHVPERSCVLSRRTAPREELIRLALGPDGEVAADVRAKAPGRGAWIGVDRPTLEAASAKGKLQHALARAFKTNDVRIPADLGERIEAALRQTVLDRLGLEAKAGHLVTGSEKIETAARRGNVRLLIHAADAADDGSRRLDQALRVGQGGDPQDRQGLVFPLGRAILSLALGRDNVVHAAIIDGAAATRVRQAIARWRAFIGPEAGLMAAPADGPGARELIVKDGNERDD